MENFLLSYHITILCLVSYFVGSIPFGYLIFKFKKGDDIRRYGSKNIGATNVNRILGKKLGLLTLILDCSKTFFTTIIIYKLYGSDIGSLCGMCSIIGHIFPVWLKFKGGKGVASFVGFLSVLSWPLVIFFCLIWLISVKLFKYSAAGAIISIALNVIFFKLILHLQFNYEILLWIPGTHFESNLIIFLSFIILFKHYSNFVHFFKK